MVCGHSHLEMLVFGKDFILLWVCESTQSQLPTPYLNTSSTASSIKWRGCGCVWGESVRCFSLCVGHEQSRGSQSKVHPAILAVLEQARRIFTAVERDDKFPCIQTYDCLWRLVPGFLLSILHRGKQRLIQVSFWVMLTTTLPSK